MGKPPLDRTTVTVKGLSTEAWEQAKKAAIKRGETQGEWLSRACLHLANLESGDVVLPAGKPKPGPVIPAVPAVDLPAVAAVLHAMGAAGVKPQRQVAGRVNRLLNHHLAASLGLPPPKARGALTQESSRATTPALPAPASAGETPR